MGKEDNSVSLPQIPRDAYYEDYVAAILNAGGYFLQRSVHDYLSGHEMLELDILACKITSDAVKNTVLEIKSGDWGIKDVFKVYGWLNYLNIHDVKGAFVFQNDIEKNDLDVMQQAASKMRIKLILNRRDGEGKLDNKLLLEHFNINLDAIHSPVIYAFRYSYALERVMLDYIRNYSIQHPEYESAAKTYQYLRKLSATNFIQQDPVDRLKFLSSLSEEHAYIAAILDNEIHGNGLKDASDKPSFVDYYALCFPKDNEKSPVHVAMHAALLNKIYVLESIVEYISLPDNKEGSKWEQFIKSLNFNSLNSNIINAIKILKERPFYYLYPYFWQVFIYAFGGYILLDKKDEEYDLLSRITGIPKDEVENAIYCWDVLFPTPNGWFSNPINDYSNIMCLKMVSPPIAGIGTNMRKYLYADEGVKDAEGLFNCLKSKLSGAYTYGDIIGWNNIGYEFLKTDTNLREVKKDCESKIELHIQEVGDFLKDCKYYTKYDTIENHIQAKGGIDTKLKGFIGYYEDGGYDLYIVKDVNNCDKVNMLNIARQLKLDRGKLLNAFIIGTDSNNKKNKDDSIWVFSQFNRINVSSLGDVIDACNDIRDICN